MQATVLAILRCLGCKDEAAFTELMRGLLLSNPVGKDGSLHDPGAKPAWVPPEDVLGRLRDFVEADNAGPLDATSPSAALSSSNSGSKALGISRREVRHHMLVVLL
jgi:hypothetical protein